MFEELSCWPEGVTPIPWPQEEVDALNERVLIALEKAHEGRQEQKREYNKTLPPHLRIIG